MLSHHVIKRPLFTEKGTVAADENNRYAFEVPVEAKKDQIKAAVQDLYKVRVVSVNTVTSRTRNRRMKYGMVEGKVSKKAIVKIHPDDKIELI